MPPVYGPLAALTALGGLLAAGAGVVANASLGAQIFVGVVGGLVALRLVLLMLGVDDEAS